ncbi:hypothetical protein [Pseudoduganella umbonata]|uniref:Uncharacterized protein n=1 Tax=Pseudoduganella umbonata TaxID=864828 RepID=A0A4P8HN41_9BURK|nr:hypothetical protein [Pseudoduganella umbonata]MBB3221282.1 hypothetical protein [Pseudoduganella umbonata]QCP10456.1 hypothetical protein FCL38_08460 [Pseudoduganella umbonata]
MNPFFFSCLCCLTMVWLGTRYRWMPVACCFTSAILLIGAFGTLAGSHVRDHVGEIENAEFRVLGAFRAIVYGLAFPRARGVHFGDEHGTVSIRPESALVRVSGVPPGTASVEQGMLVLSSVFHDGRLFTAQASDGISKAYGYVRHALPDSAEFCLAEKGAQTCANSPFTWKIDNRGRLTVTQGGTHSPACELPRSRGGNRIFPLENFGRPNCTGGSLEAVDFRNGVHPFVFLQGSGTERFIASIANQNTITQLVVLANGVPILPSPSSRLPVGEKVPLTLTVLQVDVTAPETVPKVNVFLHYIGLGGYSVEVGVSRLLSMGAFSLRSAGGPDGVLQVMLESPMRSTVSVLDTCGSRGDFAISGYHDVPANLSMAGEFKINVLSSMATVNGKGAVVSAERARTGTELFEAGCSGFGRAVFNVASPNGVIDKVSSGEPLALGDSANAGHILLTISEIGLPVWPLLLLASGACSLRAVIRYWTIRQASLPYPFWGLALLTLAESLILLRVLSVLQEAAYGAASERRVEYTLFWFVVLPLIFELLVAARVLHAWRNGRLGTILAPLGSTWHRRRAAPRWVFFAVGFVPPLIHLMLVLAGIREKGVGGLSITILLVPLYVLSFAWLYFQAKSVPENGGRHTWALSLSWAACMALACGAFFLANDTGAVFVFLTGPALLFAADAMHTGRVELKQGARRSGPIFYLTLLVTVILPVLALSALLLSVRLPPTGLWAANVAVVTEGYGWVAGLFALAVFCWMLAQVRTTRQQVTLWPGIVALTILLAGFAGTGPREQQPCQGNLATLAACYEQRSMGPNALRVARLLMPERIQGSVSREGIGMEEVFDELDFLSGQWAGTSGRGLMTLYPRIGLNRYDNAAALHLIAPFGTWTTYLLMLVFGTLLVYAFRQQRRMPLSLGVTTAAVATVVFCSASLYMLAVNLQWVLFTGKNVYLTSALSWSDLMEGAFVLIIGLSSFPVHAAEVTS